MGRSQVRTLRRTAVALGAIAALLSTSTSAWAAKPTDKPAVKVKVSAFVSGENTTIRYQVNVPASAIAAQDCTLTYPNGLTSVGCDFTPDSGSGRKLTKYSYSAFTPQIGDYTTFVGMNLVDGRHVSASIVFRIVGPAVRFSVTGLVEQPSVCYVGIDCVDWPQQTYPRQIATITAIDAAGHVATGYGGTVSFEHPLTHVTPSGLENITLTNGIGYVPVLVPSLSLGFYEEPFASNCPPGPTGNGVVLTATDTVDPSIFGCQNIAGGSLSLIFPEGFFDAVTPECPTGCLSEPTGTITIDTNLATPTALTPTITTWESMTITGRTIDGLYFTQAVDIGVIYVDGFSLPTGTLDPCTLCADDLSYYIPDVPLAVGPGVEMDGPTLTVVGCLDLPLDPDGICEMFVPVSTTVRQVEPPKCYFAYGFEDFVPCDFLGG